MRAAEDGDLKCIGVQICRDLNTLQCTLISFIDYQAATAFTDITYWEEKVSRQCLCASNFTANCSRCNQLS